MREFERGSQERCIEVKLDSFSLMLRFGKASHGMTLTMRTRMQRGRMFNIVRIIVCWLEMDSNSRDDDSRRMILETRNFQW